MHTFSCTIFAPHKACAETRQAVRLITTRATCRVQASTKTRQLPAFDPFKAGIEREFVGDHHRPKARIVRGIPQGIELSAASVVRKTPLRIGNPQHWSRRRRDTLSTRRRVAWEGIVYESKILWTVLDVALAQRPFGYEEILGVTGSESGCREGKGSASGQGVDGSECIGGYLGTGCSDRRRN
jgi:hypothetical protein